MTRFVSWWDGIELWLSGLDFVLQVIIVMPIALLLALALAVFLDTALGASSAVLRYIRCGEEPGR